MRSEFDERQLLELNNELIQMGACAKAPSRWQGALEGRTRRRPRASIATTRRSTSRRREIEALCLKLLLQQQPVAQRICVRSRRH